MKQQILLTKYTENTSLLSISLALNITSDVDLKIREFALELIAVAVEVCGAVVHQVHVAK